MSILKSNEEKLRQVIRESLEPLKKAVADLKEKYEVLSMRLDKTNITSLTELIVLKEHFDGESVEAEYIEELERYMFTLHTTLSEDQLISRDKGCETHTIFSMNSSDGYYKVVIIRRK